jgi:Zn-dependent protease
MFDINPIAFLITMAIALPSLTVHEFAHAWMAYRFGDQTAKSMGRLTLNPIAHIDFFGTIILPLIAHIGYAKPVPVNFAVLNRRQILMVALAGPVSNILLAIFLAGAFHILPVGSMSIASSFLLFGVLLNLVFAVFNLIPIPPLDGSRIVFAGLQSPKIVNMYSHFSRFGLFILIPFLIFGGYRYTVEPIVKLSFDLLRLPWQF